MNKIHNHPVNNIVKHQAGNEFIHAQGGFHLGRDVPHRAHDNSRRQDGDYGRQQEMLAQHGRQYARQESAAKERALYKHIKLPAAHHQRYGNAGKDQRHHFAQNFRNGIFILDGSQEEGRHDLLQIAIHQDAGPQL